MDFRKIEETAREVVEDFDHAYLNDLEPFERHPPTAERVAFVACTRATERLAEVAPAIQVTEVEVWETPEFRVVYRAQ